LNEETSFIKEKQTQALQVHSDKRSPSAW